MIRDPYVIEKNTLASDVLNQMNKKSQTYVFTKKVIKEK